MTKYDIVAARTFNQAGKIIQCGQILGSLYVDSESDPAILIAGISHGPLNLVSDDDDDEEEEEDVDEIEEEDNWYADTNPDGIERSDEAVPSQPEEERLEDQVAIAGDDADLAAVIIAADPKVPKRILDSLADEELNTVGDAKAYWTENGTFSELADIGDRTTEKLAEILGLAAPDENDNVDKDDK